MANEIDPASSVAALFGSRVRRLRTAAGMTQADLGRRTHVVSTRITQIERASGAKPTLELARSLDQALSADGLLVDLWPYVYRETFPDWSRAFMAYSARAVEIRQYAAHVVPGLLQTREYARAVLGVDPSPFGSDRLPERLEARLTRQSRLADADRPHLWVVLDEAVLRRCVGGPTVMREQLSRLLEESEACGTTVQVLPFDQGEHEAMGGSLTVLELPDGAKVVYLEGAEYGQLVEEPSEVERYAGIFDRSRALALPPSMSLDMIRSEMKGSHRAVSSSRGKRNGLAQQQLQQSGGWRLRRSGRRIRRRGAGA